MRQNGHLSKEKIWPGMLILAFFVVIGLVRRKRARQALDGYLRLGRLPMVVPPELEYLNPEILSVF